MGSAVLSFMLFLGIVLVLRSVIMGVLPHFFEKKRKRDEERENSEKDKEQD
jgi:cytochrome bd-type quinol oxidase subunit 1